MSRNLIFFTTGCDETYIQLTSFCIYTIGQHTDLTNIDILVMCDADYQSIICKELPHFVKFHITPNNNSPHQTSMRKCEIFDYENIQLYSKVLYLDSDIVVTGDISRMFDKISNENVLYVKTETRDNDCHNHLEHSLQLHTESQVLEFSRRNQHGFSCGHFMFCNSAIMNHHFDQVLKLMRSHTGPYFYEQSFMNHYFNSEFITDETMLEHNIDFFDSSKTSNNMQNPGATIAHFACASMPHMLKLNNMKIFYSRIISLKQ